MPGSSLWVIPPRSSTYYTQLQDLISNSMPTHFPDVQTHHFIPHVTITSQIDPSVYESDPQAWIGGLDLGLPSTTSQSETTTTATTVPITLDILEAGNPFVKKLTVRAAKTAQLLHLAAACRAEAVLQGDSVSAVKWANEDYLPHLSLMYADMPASQVQQSIASLQEECQKNARGIHADADGIVARGGSLVLVDTSKPISDWHIIAERELPNLSWTWPWNKSSFDA